MKENAGAETIVVAGAEVGVEIREIEIFATEAIRETDTPQFATTEDGTTDATRIAEVEVEVEAGAGGAMIGGATIGGATTSHVTAAEVEAETVLGLDLGETIAS